LNFAKNEPTLSLTHSKEFDSKTKVKMCIGINRNRFSKMRVYPEDGSFGVK